MIDATFTQDTERLVLRPYRETDYDMWKETYATLPKPKNRWDLGPRELKDLTTAKFTEVLATQDADMAQDHFYSFHAFEKESGKLVGHGSLMDISRVIFQNAYLCYGVHSPYWGLGYGKELAAATLQIAFHTLKLHRVEAGIEPANKRSIRLAKSLNMRREGLSKRRLYLRQKWVDMVIYALTAEDVGLDVRPEDTPLRRR